jgi:tetratricopeptide (TPR) repeat protein
MLSYDAFISYSHAKDKPVAAMLQKVVQKLGKPWYQRRALRVFRDDTSLSATPHLWPTIVDALNKSRFLVLLASPEAAASDWVAKEVAHWLENKSADTLLIGLTDGELVWDKTTNDFAWSSQTPLPKPIKGRLQTEPRWIDLRRYRHQVVSRDSRFMELAADFAATIHGVAKDDLLSQEVRQQRRILELAGAIVVTLVILAGVAGWQWWQASEAQLRAEKTLEAALTQNAKLLDRTMSNYRNTSGVGAATIRGILDSLIQLQLALTAAGNESVRLEALGADALQGLVTVSLELGDLPQALKYAQTARQKMESVVARQPSNISYRNQLANAYALEGDVLATYQKFDEALSRMRRSLAVLNTVPKTNSAYQIDNLTVHSFRIADLLLQKGDYEEALKAYNESEEYAERALASFPNDLDAARNETAILNGRCQALYSLRRYSEAATVCRDSLEMAKNIVARNPSHAQYLYGLSLDYMSLAKVLGALGSKIDSVENHKSGLAIIEKLSSDNPTSVIYRSQVALQEVLLAEAGDDSDARERIAFKIFSKMDADGSLRPEYRRLFEQLKNKAGQLPAMSNQ